MSWQIKKLFEVTQIIAGGTPKSNVNDYWNGSVFWITPADMGKLKTIYVNKTSRKITELGLQKSSAKIFPQNSVILSTRAPIGHIAINEVPMSTNQGCKSLVPHKDLETKYLFYYLTYIKKHLQELGTGTTFKELSSSKLKEVEIPIPPLSEQKQIVETLNKAFEKIDKAIANVERNIENAEELFESYLQNIFENIGDDWEVNLIKEVCELKSGTTISKKLERDKGDVIYTKVGDMNLPGNKVEITTSSRFVNFNEINLKQIIPKGAIIFPKRGGAIATNKKRKIIKPTIVDLNTMAIIPGNGIDKDYFFHWFQLFDLLSLSNGANIPQINNYSFDSVYLPYPKSKEKQREIVLTLNMLTEQKKKLLFIYTQKKSSLKELKKSILEKAFKGELTSAA